MNMYLLIKNKKNLNIQSVKNKCKNVQYEYEKSLLIKIIKIKKTRGSLLVDKSNINKYILPSFTKIFNSLSH